MTKTEVINTIQNFLMNKHSTPWEWDDFVSEPLSDPELERIREICYALPRTHPAKNDRDYCNDEGMRVLRSLLDDLSNRQEVE